MKFLKELNSKEEQLDLKNTIKSLILVFISGGIIGYIYEVIFFLIQDGKLINRGFLYGPFLPVYAWGFITYSTFFKKI